MLREPRYSGNDLVTFQSQESEQRTTMTSAAADNGRMRIAVTGSSGKLGRATVDHLRAAGHEVLGLDLVGTPGPGFTRVDLADYGQTLDALLGVTARADGFDAVVHLAAIPVNGLVPDVTT